MAAGGLGRSARGHRGAHPEGDPGRPAKRGCLSRRPPRRGRLYRARACRLGSRRTQLAHQHLLVERPRRISLLDGSRSPESRPRQRGCDFAHQCSPGIGPLLQPPRAADHGGEEARRQIDRLRRPALQHRHPRRLLGLAVSRDGTGDPAGDRQPFDPPRSLRPRVRPPLVELARISARPSFRRRGDVRAIRDRAHARVRELYVRLRGQENPASMRRRSPRWPRPWRAPAHGWRPTPGGAPRRGTWAAGRCRARSSC